MFMTYLLKIPPDKRLVVPTLTKLRSLQEQYPSGIVYVQTYSPKYDITHAGTNFILKGERKQYSPLGRVYRGRVIK